jgi:hypothetical protein
MATTDPNILNRLSRARTATPKKIYEGPKAVSAKKKAKDAQEKKEREEGGDPGLAKWFPERRMEMTGQCSLCQGQTLKYDDDSYGKCLHHLFPKEMFPSVATHPDNCIEVCFYGNSCHANLHNGTITWELLIDSAEWPMILDKVRKVVPYIAESEKRRIPECLRPFIKDLL